MVDRREIYSSGSGSGRIRSLRGTGTPSRGNPGHGKRGDERGLDICPYAFRACAPHHSTGTKSGQVLRLKGKGAPNLKTKVPGDLFVTVKVQVPSTMDEKALEAAEALDKFYQGDIRQNIRL